MNPQSSLFLLVVGLMLIHELDAVQQHEWRFFFGWSRLSDQAQCRLFTALHLPLFLLVLAGVNDGGFQFWFDVFAIVHAGLHFVLRRHPAVTFNNGFSRLWIYGSAAVAAAHLWVGLTFICCALPSS